MCHGMHGGQRAALKSLFSPFIFTWFWDLNSGPLVCKGNTLLKEMVPCSFDNVGNGSQVLAHAQQALYRGNTSSPSLQRNHLCPAWLQPASLSSVFKLLHGQGAAVFKLLHG